MTHRSGASRAARASATLVILAACVGHAAAQDQGAEPTPAATSPVAIRWNVEVIGAARKVDPADSVVNPGNRVLRLPGQVGLLDLRGNLRAEFGARGSIILRPRVQGSLAHASAVGVPGETTRDAEAQFAEAFAAWRPLDTLAITYGLQNFQWGPAELVSPSNRVFHETGLFRDALYSVRGKHLLRANVSVGRQWSLVALAELSHNGAGAGEAFQAGIGFARQGLAKFEFASADGGSYAGASVGAADGGRPWWGEYGTWMLSDALSLYVDASHARGSAAWYPTVDAHGRPRFDTTSRDARAWKTMAVMGARYTFARGDELRVEYLHQGAGYTRDQFREAVATLLAAPERRQVERFVAPGLEFAGRDLALVSWRLPDLPPGARTNVQARYLRSLTDRSGVVFTNVSLNATDAMVAFATVAVTHGAWWAEVSRLVHASATLGAVYSF